MARAPASPPRGDLAGLGTGRSVAADGGGVANVLVVASSVGMVDGVHGHPAHPGPAVPLHAELVVGVAGLEQRLLDPAAAGDLPHHRAAVALHQLLGARRELHPASTISRSVHTSINVKQVGQEAVNATYMFMAITWWCRCLCCG